MATVNVPKGRKFVILELSQAIAGWQNQTICSNTLLMQEFPNTHICGAATATINVTGGGEFSGHREFVCRPARLDGFNTRLRQ